MDIKQIRREQIKNYLIENPVDRTRPNCYVEIAKKFHVDSEYIRIIYKKLRAKGLVETTEQYEPAPDVKSSIRGSGTDLSIAQEVGKQVKNEQDLAIECGIDLNAWIITGWECKQYQAWIKNKDGEIESQPKYSVHAKLKKRNADSDVKAQKQILLQEIKESLAEEVQYFDLTSEKKLGDKMLLISVPDIHFGKLAWREETGEDYDIKIAEERFTNAVEAILKRTDISQVGRIVFPIGNDLINIDNIQKTTTSGTPQDTDIRFHKVIKIVRRILVDTINRLSYIAPVDVVVVPGNHDQQTAFMIGEILDAYYSSNPDVTVDNSPKLRKYYQFGKVGVQWTHGDKEQHNMLGLIFATEQPQLWADTKYRFCQLGHFHKNKKISFISVDENAGFQVQIIPSLSGTDAWHFGKGYNSLKQAKGFLYDKDEGLIAEYTYTV
jgi:hypothetical protein